MVRQPRPLHWVNTPVLITAIERYEQGLLPPSLRLWVRSVLELEAEPDSGSLRRPC